MPMPPKSPARRLPPFRARRPRTHRARRRSALHPRRRRVRLLRRPRSPDRPLRAVVLVGGEGTRLRPLTWTTPKQMLPVAEVPMIERVLAHLADHGVDEAVLSLGYRPDAFITAFPDGRCAGVKLTYAVEPEPLDTAGAIRFAAHHAGIAERFLAVNGDVLTDVDIGALVAFHHARGAEATIHLTRVDDPSRFGVVPTADDG